MSKYVELMPRRADELSRHQGLSGPDAASAALGYLYQQLQHQVSLLSFMDCFLVMAVQAGRKGACGSLMIRYRKIF
jgi:hypothetical protein